MYTDSLAPSRKLEITVKLKGDSITVDSQYRTCFMSPFWHVEFGAGAWFLENSWTLNYMKILSEILLLLHKQLWNTLYIISEIFLTENFLKFNSSAVKSRGCTLYCIKILTKHPEWIWLLLPSDLSTSCTSMPYYNRQFQLLVCLLFSQVVLSCELLGAPSYGSVKNWHL